MARRGSRQLVVLIGFFRDEVHRRFVITRHHVSCSCFVFDIFLFVVQHVRCGPGRAGPGRPLGSPCLRPQDVEVFVVYQAVTSSVLPRKRYETTVFLLLRITYICPAVVHLSVAIFVSASSH